jgi:hypothetical protein
LRHEGVTHHGGRIAQVFEPGELRPQQDGRHGRVGLGQGWIEAEKSRLLNALTALTAAVLRPPARQRRPGDAGYASPQKPERGLARAAFNDQGRAANDAGVKLKHHRRAQWSKS